MSAQSCGQTGIDPMEIFGLIVMLIVTWYCCANELKSVPANLIRPKAPEAGKRIFLERFPSIWNEMGFMQKVSARNIMR